MSEEYKQTNELRKEFLDELIDVMYQLSTKTQTSGEEKLMDKLALTFCETVEFSNEDGEVIDILKDGGIDEDR